MFFAAKEAAGTLPGRFIKCGPNGEARQIK